MDAGHPGQARQMLGVDALEVARVGRDDPTPAGCD
jgi:hypothetical protein